MKEYLRKLKPGHLYCPRSPSAIPRQSAHCWELATCDLEAAVNPCHEWSFPFVCDPDFLQALCCHDDQGVIPRGCMCEGEVQQLLLALTQEAQLQMARKQAELTLWEKKPKEPLGSCLRLRMLRTVRLLHHAVQPSLPPPPPSHSLQRQQTYVRPAFHSLPRMKIR